MQDQLFFLFQLIGDEALCVGQCLFAHIAKFRLDRIQAAFSDLDIVTEHAVIADLQGADAGPLFFPGFQLQYPALPVSADAAQFIEARIVSVYEYAAIFDGQRRFIHDRAIDPIMQLLASIDVPVFLIAGAVFEQIEDDRRMFKRAHQAQHIARRRAAIRYPCAEAFQVIDITKVFLQLIPDKEFAAQIFDRIQPLLDLFALDERILDPFFQHP